MVHDIYTFAYGHNFLHTHKHLQPPFQIKDLVYLHVRHHPKIQVKRQELKRKEEATYTNVASILLPNMYWCEIPAEITICYNKTILIDYIKTPPPHSVLFLFFAAGPPDVGMGLEGNAGQ